MYWPFLKAVIIYELMKGEQLLEVWKNAVLTDQCRYFPNGNYSDDTLGLSIIQTWSSCINVLNTFFILAQQTALRDAGYERGEYSGFKTLILQLKLTQRGTVNTCGSELITPCWQFRSLIGGALWCSNYITCSRFNLILTAHNHHPLILLKNNIVLIQLNKYKLTFSLLQHHKHKSFLTTPRLETLHCFAPINCDYGALPQFWVMQKSSLTSGKTTLTFFALL